MNTQLAFGLATLMGRLQKSEDFLKQYWHARDHEIATFDQHPFGHSVALRREGGDNHSTYLVGMPGDTKTSIPAILLMLQHELFNIPSPPANFRLRITRVVIGPDWKDDSRSVHDQYFELVSWNGTYICAGLDEGSGTGGQACKDLETIFNFIGQLFEVLVEEEVIPAGRRDEISALFEETHNRHFKLKTAA